MAEQKIYGYVGKIARIDLTDSTVEIIPTSRYVPEYIGGRQICHKIFWDEVGPAGPTAGTGIPSGSRAFMAGIAASTYPEQYSFGSFGSIGGWIAAEIKYAGFDGFILQGKAKEPCYILIDNGKIEIHSAEGLWDKLVHPAQEWLKERHGVDTRSMVIGPAGEHLCRDATITTSNDNAFSKSGFGAVMGSKNLKGVAVKGKGAVVPADIDKVFELRKTIGTGPMKAPNPIIHQENPTVGGGTNYVQTTSSPGCTFRCHKMQMGLQSAFEDKKVNQVEKCASAVAWMMSLDVGYPAPLYVHSKRNHSASRMRSGAPLDTADPDFPKILSDGFASNKAHYVDNDYARGHMLMHLCNEYGLDKYEITIWLQPWLSMCKKLGLLDELDFGMEPDVNDIELNILSLFQ